MSQYVYNKHNTTWKVLCTVFTYIITRCFCIRNLTRSLRSLVRFLIRQQLVRQYRTPALSMKYSLYTLLYYRDERFDHTSEIHKPSFQLITVIVLLTLTPETPFLIPSDFSCKQNERRGFK